MKALLFSLAMVFYFAPAFSADPHLDDQGNPMLPGDSTTNQAPVDPSTGQVYDPVTRTWRTPDSTDQQNNMKERRRAMDQSTPGTATTPSESQGTVE